VKILFIGDIVGKGGRKAVNRLVPRLRQEHGCDFVLANGENMAGGGGITSKCLQHTSPSGIDVFTGGDHIWDQRSFEVEVLGFPNVLRPANVNAAQPGRGYGVFKSAGGIQVAVLSLLGRTFINTSANCPFEAAGTIVPRLLETTPVVIVDFHAEATSEKIAMGRFLDGQASAVLGTHTHVETADETVFPGGTAYQTDVGMVGGRESVLGREIAPVVHRFSTGMPARFTVVERGIVLHATLLDIDSSTGKARGIRRIEVEDSEGAAA
jgi:hypothetical protein